MSLANWLPAAAVLGPASLAGLTFFVIYRLGVTGLKSMGQPSLQLRERHLIGRYTLMLVLAVIVLAVLIALLHPGKSASAHNTPLQQRAVQLISGYIC